MALDIVSAYALAESTFGSDPDSDGSSYLVGSIIGNPLPSDEYQLAETNYATGRNRDTAAVPAVDLASIPLEMPMVGLSAAATDASPTPTAVDFVDTIVTSALGASATVVGDGLAAGGTTTTVVVDNDVRNVEDLILTQFATNSQWRNITAESGGPVTYTVTPAMSGAPDAALDVFGYRYWLQTDNGGPTFSYFSSVGGTGWRLSGCKPTSLKFILEAGKPGRISTTIRADSLTQDSGKSSLPAASLLTTPMIIGKLGSVYWGTTSTPISKLEIDFRLNTVDVMDLTQTNGRGDIIVTRQKPRITIFPADSTALSTDFRAGTERSLLIQMGNGLLSAARVNTWCFFAQTAQIKSNKIVSDGGYLRRQLVIDVTDAGIRTGTTAYRYWTLARA